MQKYCIHLVLDIHSNLMLFQMGISVQSDMNSGKTDEQERYFMVFRSLLHK